MDTLTLFEEPWWLDAVAPGGWRSTSVTVDGRCVARWPIVVRRRLGCTLVMQPPLTPSLGPWMERDAAAPAKRRHVEREHLEALIAGLPRCDHVRLALDPRYFDWLPFHWHGFRQQTAYTYRLTDLTDRDLLFRGFTDKTRNVIRKAERTVTVDTTPDTARLWEQLRLAFDRQGLQVPFTRSLLERIDRAADGRDARRMYFGVDTAGRTHAAVYTVGDARGTYYLLAGGDPALRSSGASMLCLWRAIQDASAAGSALFDFEGSMLRPIEGYVRGFGGTLTPYHLVSWSSRRFQVLEAGHLAWTALRRSPQRK